MVSPSHHSNFIPQSTSFGAIVLLALSIVVGQLVRIPIINQGGGLLVSDVVIVIILLGCVLAWLFGGIGFSAVIRPFKIYSTLITPFFIWAFVLLIVHEYALGAHSFFIALLYLVRLFAVSLLLPALLVVATKQRLQKVFVAMYWALIVLGYMQLAVFPSLVGNINGWDPHIHRMVSTWFDPNFFGAFIVIGLFPALYWSRFKIMLFCMSLGALVLTGSRSSWVAIIIATIITLCIYLVRARLRGYWKKGAYLMLLGVFFLTIVVIGLFSNRISGFFVHDPTVALRAAAYVDVWHRLVEPNIFIGVGYNAYQFAAKSAGLIQDFTVHSRAGSDNSVVNLLVTTGIVGAILFLAPFLAGLYWHGKQWVLHNRTQSLLFIWALTALFVHSQFENSLLYPHLLISLIMIAVAIL